MYFDIEEKHWKQLSSLAPAADARNCFCAKTVGGELFLAIDSCIYCYDIETDKWKTHNDPTGRVVKSLCTVGDYMYAISSDCNEVTQRYSFPKRQRQSFAKVIISEVIPTIIFTVGQRPFFQRFMYFMDISGKLCVAGGYNSIDKYSRPCGNPAAVEVYDEDNNKWSVVDQKHIPQNTLGALEIEGRVYFIINTFPIDSGIRIPSGEVYPVYLGDWKNLENVANNAARRYVPLKRDSVKAD